MYKHSVKKEIDYYDIKYYCPTSIKQNIQWFTFLSIMEHTANILKQNKSLISSLIKVFVMFQLRIFNDNKYET